MEVWCVKGKKRFGGEKFFMETAANGRGWQAILVGGLVAGVLDITAACVSGWLLSGASPMRIFQSVAGGLYGKAAFEGGMQTALLGLALHFLIATTATAVYYLASRKLSFLVNQSVLAGVIYGVLMWCFMYLIVIPLTPLGAPTYSFSNVLRGVLIHIFFVGLPIALVVRRFSR